MRRDAPGALAARAARPWQTPVRLEIDGLALAAGGRTLLSGLSASLEAGERWVVLGPNGAGKSTLIAALAGLLRPAAGTLRLQARRLADWPAAALAGWRAWCPTSWSDPFPLRVDEALRSVAHAHAPGSDAAEARLGALLRALDLEALADHDVGRLSSGERQRVAIAAALMQDTPLLLLDEPSSHLDYAHRQMLAAALEAHAARGGLVVASLHELDLAWSLATHALLLQGPTGPPGRRADAPPGVADDPDAGLRVWAGPREAVMTPARLSRVYGVPVAEVEVCGERRFWVGPRRPGAGMIAAMAPNTPVAGLHLVLGGARSGKSAYAQSLAAAQEAAGREVCVVATALGADEEMRARIARHRADRPAHWRLLEPPPTRHALAEAIEAHADARRCLLVDCLTLWLSQAIAPPPGHAPLDPDDETAALLAALRRAAGPVLLVGNEIGLGVIPLDASTRRVVDALGTAHQRIAALAERVTWMVAGLPVAVKGGAA